MHMSREPKRPTPSDSDLIAKWLKKHKPKKGPTVCLVPLIGGVPSGASGANLVPLVSGGVISAWGAGTETQKKGRLKRATKGATRTAASVARDRARDLREAYTDMGASDETVAAMAAKRGVAIHYMRERLRAAGIEDQFTASRRESQGKKKAPSHKGIGAKSTQKARKTN